MLDTPQITQTAAQLTPSSAHHSAGGDTESHGSRCQRADGHRSRPRHRPRRRMVHHHLRMDPAIFDFEIGVPSRRPLLPRAA